MLETLCMWRCIKYNRKMLKYIGEHPNINDDEIMNKVEEILGCPSYEKEKEMMKRFMPSSLDDSQ
jgi:uncharacterized protein YneF (UPF0154 family)